jgi:hypothetical protein
MQRIGRIDCVIDAIEDVFLVPLVMKDCKFGRIEETARI